MTKKCCNKECGKNSVCTIFFQDKNKTEISLCEDCLKRLYFSIGNIIIKKSTKKSKKTKKSEVI